MSEKVFNLPDVGEGLTEADLVTWLIKVGDTVELNQTICEIETAKSLVELPSPFVGTVTELIAQVGDTVPVGAPLLKVDDGVAAAATGENAPVSDEDAEIAEAVADVSAGVNEEKQAVLVGYGSQVPARSRRRSGGEPLLGAKPSVADSSPVLVKPPIRKLAKDLGVDLASVRGSGIGGEVLRDDVVRHASQASVFRNLDTPEAASSREERIPVKGVRKTIANAMTASAFSAPHVSVFTEIDATRTMEYVKRLKASPDFAGVKVSPLLVMAKAIIWAVRRNPMVNSTWTDEEIIVHNFVNLGIAAATPRGLLVPNIKEAQDLSMLNLAKEIEKLTLTAREGRTTPEEMANGTITVTNIGVFGMDTGTPILNPGEVAIVAMGTIKEKPWVVNGEILPRMVTTVAGSFDHRVVDGDVVSRFIADVASVIEEPALLLD
ncbi:dihydrolipoamide acetyltransferase family protein [Canibacter zhoujuaniae]|uniref:dihydrolipoamide acetyltransferase family protein n=1 Tax=Canibacter zhoujuaniae TaxID=2708343 RepID=UPI00141F8C7D|nr:dihydrolipoamide acetyltransferase family protein [Canibacter zhoujuaniae]